MSPLQEALSVRFPGLSQGVSVRENKCVSYQRLFLSGSEEGSSMLFQGPRAYSEGVLVRDMN